MRESEASEAFGDFAVSDKVICTKDFRPAGGDAGGLECCETCERTGCETGSGYLHLRRGDFLEVLYVGSNSSGDEADEAWLFGKRLPFLQNQKKTFPKGLESGSSGVTCAGASSASSASSFACHTCDAWNARNEKELSTEGWFPKANVTRFRELDQFIAPDRDSTEGRSSASGHFTSERLRPSKGLDKDGREKAKAWCKVAVPWIPLQAFPGLEDLQSDFVAFKSFRTVTPNATKWDVLQILEEKHFDETGKQTKHGATGTSCTSWSKVKLESGVSAVCAVCAFFHLICQTCSTAVKKNNI